ncbi:MAG: DUF1573 domain-containing protein, partial [Lentisphaeraceae bacterium]|nr:DUF1573 domain-containing protein [Lentisphaeraceae bacterium]
MIRLCALCMILFSSSIMAGELLSWEKDKLSYSAKLSDKGTLFTFKFKNDSGKEVNIEKIKSSCSC